MPQTSQTSPRWSFSAGKYGSKARVFERSDRKGLWIKYQDPIAGEEVQYRLKTDSRVRAKQKCREVAELLEQNHRVLPGENLGTDPARIDELFGMYSRERSRHKKGTGPAEDERRRKLWLGYFVSRETPVLTIEHLDQTVIEDFIRVRRHGDLQVPGVKLPDPAPPAARALSREEVVKPRTIHADLVYLNTVLNWAQRKTANGRPLIERNPIRIPMLKTPKPSRPVATHDDYKELRPHADVVDRQGLYGCFLRLQEDLGWRVTGICHIRGCEIDFDPLDAAPYGSIQKNPLVDKKGCGDWVPLSRHARATLARCLRIRGLRPGSQEYLFPRHEAPANPGPASMYVTCRSVQRLQRSYGPWAATTCGGGSGRRSGRTIQLRMSCRLAGGMTGEAWRTRIARRIPTLRSRW